MMGVVFYFMIIWIIHGLVIYRLFKSGTCSYKLTKVNAKDPDGNWFCVGMELPEEFENYDYSSFYYKVEELVDCDAYYNNTEKMRCVSPEQL